MSDRLLPKTINVGQFVALERRVDGILTLTDLPRLRGDVAGEHAEIAVELVFLRDEINRPIIKSHIKGNVTLKCQRCLEFYRQPISSDSLLAVVANESMAEALPDSYEAVVSEDNSVDLYRMVEDECLLSLPLIARHHATDCDVLMPTMSGTLDETMMEKSTPFAVLEELI